MRATGLVALVALALPQGADGQIARRVAHVDAGTVRFEYATKRDVEICDQGVRIGDRHMRWRSRGWDDDARNCRIGSAEIELRVQDGVVRDVELLYRERDRTPGAVELGEVAPGEAARYLLALAREEGATSQGAKNAIFPAMIADVDGLWRDLADIALDRDLLEGVRKNALFWLGQEAADAATDGLAEVALDEQEDQEIRNAAIFALSQRPHEEGTPVLMELARTGREAETRRSSMFWLAQSDDDRVIRFFEDILLGRIR